MVKYRYETWRDLMNNDTWTYDDYLEWDREYREVEYLLETYNIEDIREYIAKKYGVDND